MPQGLLYFAIELDFFLDLSYSLFNLLHLSLPFIQISLEFVGNLSFATNLPFQLSSLLL